MNRRTFLQTLAGSTLAAGARGREQSAKPNIVFIYADDLGYGDLGCYGSRIRTPKLDGMAREGVRFTNFESASPVCSPARAALLTGRYPAKVGVGGVLDASDPSGLLPGQPTIADVLKAARYSTKCVGKWHVGSRPEYMPTARGFDEFFGLPYSHDMWPRPLMRGCEVVEQPARLDSLTSRFTDEAVEYIRRERNSPFFLYLAHTAPHIPLVPSAPFRGKSKRGVYHDVVQELDWSVGEVLNALEQTGQSENTIVMFSSDNGPWHQGSNGQLRGRKGENFEGGVRVPLLARWPGRFEGNRVVDGLTSALDILPTLASLAGAGAPAGMDGVNIAPLLTGRAEAVERDILLYFDWWSVQAARMGDWKVHFSRYNSYPWGPAPEGGRRNLPLPKPELYALDTDPDESSDLSDEAPEIIEQIRMRVEELLPTFPEQVANTWYDTMKIAVENTPSGALPIAAKPPL